jgi:hypothetical protein
VREIAFRRATERRHRVNIPRRSNGAHATARRRAVERLRSCGFGVCRIVAGEKIPTYKRWTHASLESADFEHYPGANLGILGGTLSGNLVIIDADKPAIRAAAARWLPRTMTDGRPSTGSAHWYFRVTDVPTWAATGPDVAGGLGGPRIMHFADAAGRPIGLDFLGTGAQVVCPPSLHHSGERRLWLVEPEEIITLPFMELWLRVKELAKNHGAANADRERAAGPNFTTHGNGPTFPPSGDVQARALAYLAKCAPAISGQAGHNRTFAVARALAWGFDLGADRAFELLQQYYNPRCQPPWTDAELMHKCEDADRAACNKPRAWLRDRGGRRRHKGSGHRLTHVRFSVEI